MNKNSLITLPTENLSMEKSAEILNVIPLGLFYYAFSVEDDRLTTVLCELIGKILHPFTYDQIVSDENKVGWLEVARNYLYLQLNALSL